MAQFRLRRTSEMASDYPALTLTIPSDLSLLPVVRSFVEAACQVGEYDKSVLFAVVMATGEAYSNIVHHAHRDQPDAMVQIRCRIAPESIDVDFSDQGPPFDITAVPNYNPSEVRLGGRGVYMIRRLMDEVRTSPRAGGGNTLRMVKYRTSPSKVRDCG